MKENGALIPIPKLDFDSKEVYVVDDNNLINIWIGKKVISTKKESVQIFRKQLEEEKDKDVKIFIMEENREYGSFLAIMNDLKLGNIPEQIQDERPEFTLEKPKTEKWMEQIELYREWSPDKKEMIQKKADEKFSQFDINDKDISEILKPRISLTAYYISQEKYEYNELCWMLAERIMRQYPKASIEDIRLKSEEIFRSSASYDEVCWLIAQMDVLGKEKYIKNTKISFL